MRYIEAIFNIEKTWFSKFSLEQLGTLCLFYD